MARVVLREDCLGQSPSSAPVWLDEDPLPDPVPEVPVLQVRQRYIKDYSLDGNPQWRWQTLVEGPATDWEERVGTDPGTGTTKITATATILYEGAESDVSESAVVVRVDDGRRYQVTKVHTPTPGYLRLQLTSSEQR